MSSTCNSPRRSRSHSTSTSPTHPPSKRAFSAASPRNMVHRGKRARRSSSSSRPPSITIPIASSSDPSSAIPTATPLAAIPTNVACSAPPSTPLFPSASTTFSPRSHLTRPDPDIRMDSSPLPSPPNSHTNLDALHREAFTSLRHSVAESGEGFVRRMREWEQQRHPESNKATILGSERERDKRRDRWGGRRSRAARVDQRSITTSGSHPGSDRFSFPEPCRQNRKDHHTMRSPFTMRTQDETDDEDDIATGGLVNMSGVDHPQKKRHSISLGDVTMDVIEPPELFDVEIADSDGEMYASTRFNSNLDFSFTYSNTRSSSPSSFPNTSDDESSCSRHGQTHSGLSSPHGCHHSVDWSITALSSRSAMPSGPQNLRPAERGGCLSPCTSSLSSSPKSSHARSSVAAPCYENFQAPGPNATPTSPSGLAPYSVDSPQIASDKAVAALVLALSNGSGSLADYGSVREAQGDLEELDAGALWE